MDNRIAFDRNKCFASFIQTANSWSLLSTTTLNVNIELEKYIINENATILFWNDGTKTISKRHKEDKFDKELGFLFAYFYKKWGVSKASGKRIIESIKEDKIKQFLFEFYVKDSGKDIEKAKKYLSNLVMDK